MKKYALTFLILFFSAISITLAQDIQQDSEVQKPASSMSLGIGLGLDYGGIGTKWAFSPSQNVSLFAGLGYNFKGLGYNFGLALKPKSEKRVVPYVTAMYGYNAVIVIQGLSDFRKAYYGPTFGFGLELNSRRNENFWNIGLYIPVRSKEFKDTMDALKNNPMIEIADPWPIAFSFGYNFRL
jgi:hypothetical protein